MGTVGKVALVTGAGTGIGQAVSLALQEAGYAVVLAGRRIEELRKTAALAKPSGGEMAPIVADVSNASSVQSLFQQLADRFGRLDLLFNNAGTNVPSTPIEDLSEKQWNHVVGVNMTGAFLCAQQAVRLMKTQSPSGGRIINNGSVSAHVPRPNSVPYTMTKHAITGLTKCICLDGRNSNIACSQIDIGNAATESTRGMAAGVAQPNGAVVPEARMDVRHVAEAVLYMAGLPVQANVPFMVVMATAMPFFGRG